MVNSRPRAVFPVGKETVVGDGGAEQGAERDAYVVAAPFDTGNQGSVMPARLELPQEGGGALVCDVEFHRIAVEAIKGFRSVPWPAWGGGYFEFEGIPEEFRVDKGILRDLYQHAGPAALVSDSSVEEPNASSVADDEREEEARRDRGRKGALAQQHRDRSFEAVEARPESEA